MIQADMTLKTAQGPFRAVWRGEKTAELRQDDRGFQVGDVISLIEWDKGDARWSYPYRKVTVRVTHIVRVSDWVDHMGAIPWVMLSFKVLERRQMPKARVCRGCRGEAK